HRHLTSFPTRRSSDLHDSKNGTRTPPSSVVRLDPRSGVFTEPLMVVPFIVGPPLSLKNATSVFLVSFSSFSFLMTSPTASSMARSEEHTSELQSQSNL